MRYLGALVAALLLTMGFAGTPKAQAAERSCEPYNGGVIILLRAEYSFYTRSGGVKTLVIVASDAEVDELNDRLTSEEDVRYVHLDRSRLNMQLNIVSDDELTGSLISNGTSVMVVTQEYAAEHGF